MAPTITSTFDHGAEGWTVDGDASSQGWKSAGGHPGGYFSWVDAASGSDAYFQAPKRFLGKKGAFYAGTLSYSVLDSGNNYTAYDVKLVGAGHTLEYTGKNDATFPKAGVWSTRTVHLNPLQFIDADTGAAPSAAELRAVLADLTDLEIRAEYVSGGESGGLDSVTLAPRVTPAAAASTLVQSAAAFGANAGPGHRVAEAGASITHAGAWLASVSAGRLHASAV